MKLLWIGVPLILSGADPDFAGSVKCAGCHPAIYRLQHASHHAQTLRPPAEVSELVRSLPFRFQDRTTGAELLLSRTDTNGIELSASSGAEKHRVGLRWAFGSGAQGITTVGLRDDGRPIESRLTWYRAMGGFDLTTGASKQTPLDTRGSLGRELSAEELNQCLGCHGNRVELGVQCESCHGPGANHATAMAAGRPDATIGNPGRLDAFAQVQLCGKCHGRPPEDTDLAGLRAIEEDPNTVRFASPRLVLSRCFNESGQGLNCVTCHNPHQNAARAESHYDQICSACHDQSRRKRAAMCPVGKENCSSCHMPRSRVMAHSSFTDHWIRVTQ